MEKFLMLLIIFIICCGCSNNMTCVYKLKYEDVNIQNKITFDFNNKKYIILDTMSFKNNEEAKRYFEDIEEYQEEYNLILDGKKIISKLEYNIEEGNTKSTLKQKYESYDYECK